MSISPAVSPSAQIDYSTASWEELRLWFCEHYGVVTHLNELCTGVAYCHLLADLFPGRLLNRQNIRQFPTSFTERAINWMLMGDALYHRPLEEMDIPELVRPYGRGTLDFCRWFVSFFESHKHRGHLRRQEHYSVPIDYHALGYSNRCQIRKFLDDGLSNNSPFEYDHSDVHFIIGTMDEGNLMSELREEFSKRNKITTKEIVQMIGAKKGEIITRKMLAEWKAGQEKKREETSSMWDYNERCLPKEFVDLDPSEFLTKKTQKNLCFLATDILIQICEKLPPSDFVNLSLTCRYIHWRMFAFTKCHVPKTATISIREESIKSGEDYEGLVKDLYIRGKELKGIFVAGPAAVLKKPFFFQVLELELTFDYYGKPLYDKCLPYILPLRQRCNQLMFRFEFWNSFREAPIDYSTTNDLFKVLKVDGYRVYSGDEADSSTLIFFKCSYARQMKNVRVCFDPTDPATSQLYPPAPLVNNYGWYLSPSFETLVATIVGFISGHDDLEFHVYAYNIELFWIDGEDGNEERWRHIFTKIREYFLSQFIDLEEFYSSRYEHVWMETIAEDGTGRDLKLKIIQSTDSDALAILIGKKEKFDEMEGQSQSFLKPWFYPIRRNGGDKETLWKMETAVESGEETAGSGPDE